MRELVLLLHFVGFGLLMTANVAGSVLELQYRKAPDLQSKAVILRALRPIGLISPLASLLMLITGIGNMHALGLGILDMGWLTAKIIFFGIAVVSGLLFGTAARKRGGLVRAMAAGTAKPDAERLLIAYDTQIKFSYLVMPVLLLVILSLSVYGRLGGQ